MDELPVTQPLHDRGKAARPVYEYGLLQVSQSNHLGLRPVHQLFAASAAQSEQEAGRARVPHTRVSQACSPTQRTCGNLPLAARTKRRSAVHISQESDSASAR